jgi:hypothetical protein
MKENTAELKGCNFNGQYRPKLIRIGTEPRQKIRQKLRGFLPLNIEAFAESLPKIQGFSRRSSGFNPSL